MYIVIMHYFPCVFKENYKSRKAGGGLSHFDQNTKECWVTLEREKKIIRLWVSVYVSTHMFAADPSIRLIALGLSEISVSIMLTTGKADS